MAVQLVPDGDVGSQVARAMDAIRMAIVRGEYLPGHRLKEAELADQLDMSRTPVREAIRLLAGEGLVEHLSNRGAAVATWDVQDLDEIFEMRSVLEALAAERVATLRPDLGSLEALHAEMQAITASDDPGKWDDYARVNNTFHRRIAELSGNGRLAATVIGLIAIPLFHREFGQDSQEALERSDRQHEDMVAAMREGDARWASAMACAHIRSTKLLLLGDGK